jgi:Arc-like DNA binding domain
MSDRDPYRFLLRMPPELRAPLREAAERNGRSLNGEIVARLESTVAGRRTVPRLRRPRLVPAIAVAGVFAVAASGAFVQQRSGTDPHQARSTSAATAKRALVPGPSYAAAKRTIASRPQ